MHNWCSRTLAALCFLAITLPAARGAETDGKGHRLLVAGTGTRVVAIVDANGKIEWSYPVKGPTNDAWLLPNGNVLFAYGKGAMEVTREKQVVWQYPAPAGDEIHSVQPLPDGKYLVAQNGHPPRLLEMTKDGKIVKDLHFETKITRPHLMFRQVRKTPVGTYLAGFVSEPKVREYAADGSVLRTFDVPRHGYAAVRLPDGNTLIPCGDGHALVEFDAEGKEVWRVNENDIPGNPLRFVAGVQRLPNGNTVIANWLGHGGHTGKQPQLLEITRDKKLVWTFWDPKALGNLSTVQVLEVGGDVTKGEVLR